MKNKIKFDFKNHRVIINDVSYCLVPDESYKSILANAIRYYINSNETSFDIPVTYPIFNRRLVPEYFLFKINNFNILYLNNKLEKNKRV